MTNLRSSSRAATSLGLLAGALAIVAGGVLGCSTQQTSLGEPTGSTCPSASTLTYDNFGKAFIANHCLECHASRESPQLTTLEEIQGNLEVIDRAAASGPKGTNDYMPQDEDVATAERQKLGEWLACGAP
jgi:hypothetical protein